METSSFSSEESGFEILLVEDSPADARLLQHILLEEGFQEPIRWLTDGAEAIEYLFRQGAKDGVLPKLIILDLNLPKIDGREVLKRLKTHPRASSIPVIVLTTSNRENDRIVCLKHKAAGFFSKPSDIESYERLVRRFVAIEFKRYGIFRRRAV